MNTQTPILTNSKQTKSQILCLITKGTPIFVHVQVDDSHVFIIFAVLYKFI